MPPKTKTKKKKSVKEKSSLVVDGLSTEDMSKDQLEEHIIRLREELDREREERSYFQLERDKIHSYWEVSQRRLEEVQAELRNRRREKEEADERHRVEITVYKQKLKHVLLEHHDASTEVKTVAVATRHQTETDEMRSEFGLRGDVGGLRADVRESTVQGENFIKELKLKHQVELMELNNKYERRIREQEVKYAERMMSLVEEEESRRRSQISELEERMRSRVKELKEEQDRDLRRVEEVCSGALKKKISDLKSLKEELEETRQKEARTQRRLLAARQENSQLKEELKEEQSRLPRLEEQLEEHRRNQRKQKAARAELELVKRQIRDLSLENELLLQNCEKVERERDELLRRQRDELLDVQQRRGLKEMLLRRKMEALRLTLEQEEARLYATLTLATDQTGGNGAANRLEDIMEGKRVTMETLQDQLTRQCQEYDELLVSCQERLRLLNIPLNNFNFKTSDQILEAHPDPTHHSHPGGSAHHILTTPTTPHPGGSAHHILTTPTTHILEALAPQY
ncbi:dynein regulatory complex subunit 4 [Pholidichthys leucotaenia]